MVISFRKGNGSDTPSVKVEESKTVNIETNGITTITPSEGYDAISDITVRTDVEYNLPDGCKFYNSTFTSFAAKGLNSNNMTDMSAMFQNCANLTSIDLTNLYANKVAKMNSMFQGCTAIESITMPTLQTQGKITNVNGIFANCGKLTSISMYHSWEGVTNIKNAFLGCTALTTIDHIISLPDMDLTDWKIDDCTALTVESLVLLINALPTASASRTCTIGATNLAKLTAAQIKVATDKGWTLN